VSTNFYLPGRDFIGLKRALAYLLPGCRLDRPVYGTLRPLLPDGPASPRGSRAAYAEVEYRVPGAGWVSRILAIVHVQGRDQKGVVARISTYLAERNINIEDIEQRVVRGQFLMDMLIDITDATVTLDELVTGLLAIGQEIGMEIRVTLHSERQRQRVAVLVSKEPHCLEQLIADWRSGDLRGDLVCVLSNHDVLRPVAEAAGIPFEWYPSDDKAAHEAFLLDRLAHYRADLVVLARYMQILTPTVVQPYAGRIINIHPSLLPYFPARIRTAGRGRTASG
jgi:formyltetrahydrofolate deformylase